MKKVVIPFLILLLGLIGCNQPLKDRIAALEAENQALRSENLKLKEASSIFQKLEQSTEDQLWVPYRLGQNQSPSRTAEEHISHYLGIIKSSGQADIIGSATNYHKAATAYIKYVDELKEKLIDVSGGYNERGLIKYPRNKEATNKLFLIDKEGERLEIKIRKLIELGDSIRYQYFEGTESVELDMTITDESLLRDKSWPEFNFREMPAGAILPMLSKFRNDAVGSQIKLLRALSEVAEAKK